MMSIEIFNESDQAGDFTSTGILLRNPTYSVGLVISGTFDVDVKLQTSMDGENFVDITDSLRAGLTDALEVIQYDINLGFHKFVRILITHNSGTYSAKGYVN